VHVKIPMATLDSANTGIKYIDLENYRATAEAKIWVDDAEFSS
jgi:hypothetical protein